MPLRKAIFFLLLLSVVTSCWWHDVRPPLPPPSPAIYYSNSAGQNLLDATTPHYFDSVSIHWINRDGTSGTQHGYIYLSSINSVVSYLPDGYYLSISPYILQDNNGNSGILNGNTCTVFIRLTKTDTDTVTFTYSPKTLTSFYYNNTLITPPAGLTAYPPFFPVMITK